MQQNLAANLIRLARPRQWAKGVFVAIGPAYAIATRHETLSPRLIGGALAAIVAFGLASSFCYIINDIRDADADRAHPRKRTRPIASGAVPVRTALRFAVVLLLLAAAAAAATAFAPDPGAPSRACWLGLCLAAYTANTTLYSLRFKHEIVLDVISLASGFVLRVLGGCAAAGVEPSTNLLNVTFFLSMFLALGKRLGERRTMGGERGGAAAARAVQQAYTDELLRMAVVVTGVATLISYAAYIEKQGDLLFKERFNLLWLTILPATYGLIRCIVLLERGAYDDPTELASRDRPLQAAAGLFALLTALAMLGVSPQSR